MECDSASSLIIEVEAGRGIAVVTPILGLVAGKRLLYRALTGTTEAQSVGIARATKGEVTPAGERFCEILRKISGSATAAKPKHQSFPGEVLAVLQRAEGVQQGFDCLVEAC